MFTVYIISLALLILGGILCYRGIKIYKIAQMILCGAIGGYVGLMLVASFGKQEFYILALALTVLGGFLGYKHYKYSLYLCVFISSFYVTFSYFWQQASAAINEGVEQVVGIKNAVQDNMTGVKTLQDTLDSFDAIMGIYNNNWALVIKGSGDILKHGLVVSFAVALVAVILTKLIGDYVIMTVSSAFGAMLLAMLAEMFVSISPMMHLLIIVVLGLSGIIVQYNTCRR